MRRLLVGLTVFLLLLSLPQNLSALLQGNRIVLVDDFEDRNFANLLEGESRGDADCVSRFVNQEEALGRSGASLSLAYHLSEVGSFSYFLVELGKEKPADLAEMRYLSFWMNQKALSGGAGLEFGIEARTDTDGDNQFSPGKDPSARLPVKRYVVRKREDGWEKVVIPLTQFRKIVKWDRVTEVLFVLAGPRQGETAEFLLDDILFGSHYPENFAGKEISMQNRVSSFKIEGELADREMKLKSGRNSLSLTLTFVDPYLEEIRFEASRDGGATWQRIHSFYDHLIGGTYQTVWEVSRESTGGSVVIRALAVDFLGGETQIAGPYHLNLN
jgi:hypothetical protein